jgi:acyl-CoA dehydrogenase
MGELGLVRGLFGGAASELPQSAAAIQLCLLREALARVSGEAETALALQGLGSYPIMQSSSPEQIERWLPRVVTGAAVAAFALSNRAPGQDALRLATSSTFTRWADGSPRQSSSIWRVR